MTIDCMDDVPGAKELCEWFERVPSFHDAYLTSLSIDVSGRGRARVRAFRMTTEIDDRGHYVLDKHCAVHFDFEQIQIVELDGFMPGPAILDRLDIQRLPEGISVRMDPIYGVGGSIVAKGVSLTWEPVEYDGVWPPK